VNSLVRYRAITSSTGVVFYTTDIRTTATKTQSDPFVGTVRRRLADEAAMRSDIELFLQQFRAALDSLPGRDEGSHHRAMPKRAAPRQQRCLKLTRISPEGVFVPTLTHARSEMHSVEHLARTFERCRSLFFKRSGHNIYTRTRGDSDDERNQRARGSRILGIGVTE